jgi:hypothetical protein
MTDDQILVRDVDYLEASPEFLALSDATEQVYASKSKARSSSWLRIHIGNYFRMSGRYQALYRGESYNLDAVIAHYWSALTADTNTVLYLAPIELVAFGSDMIPCGDFEIRRFSADELNAMVGNSVRKVFYKWAYIDPTALIAYWFICIREPTAAKRMGFFDFDVKSFELVKPSYSAHPERIEYVLRRLSLFDWDKVAYSSLGAPIYPHIPFVLVISDSLISHPEHTPSFASLATVPFMDSVSGEEIGESPVVALYLEGESTEHTFSAFMVHVFGQLRTLHQCGPRWSFIETALGFLVKAFVSKGVDQLLWHITAIEAVLGENASGGITEKLATRVAHIIGKDKTQRTKVKEGFKKLYHLRSKLVHGDVELTQKEIYNKSLHQARYCARAIVYWAIGYLSHIANTIEDENATLPTRKALLRFVDMTPHERQESLFIGRALPKEFPNVTQWTRTPGGSDTSITR